MGSTYVPKYSEYGKEKVQTTKFQQFVGIAAKAVVGKKILWPRGRAGSIPAPGTKAFMT
ncbi:MAG: hypothetical protein AAF960_11205 [Bacteroidota bacterium]